MKRMESGHAQGTRGVVTIVLLMLMSAGSILLGVAVQHSFSVRQRVHRIRDREVCFQAACDGIRRVLDRLDAEGRMPDPLMTTGDHGQLTVRMSDDGRVVARCEKGTVLGRTVARVVEASVRRRADGAYELCDWQVMR